MSNIDKRALREAAEKAISEEGGTWWNEDQLASDYGLALHRPDAKFIAAANPATVLALLDELEALDRRNAELNSTLERWATDRAKSASELDDAEKRIAELEARSFNPALLDVIAERQRQVSAEGWTPEHDDQYEHGQLLRCILLCHVAGLDI
jgi:hypothetical protein